MTISMLISNTIQSDWTWAISARENSEIMN